MQPETTGKIWDTVFLKEEGARLFRVLYVRRILNSILDLAGREATFGEI